MNIEELIKSGDEESIIMVLNMYGIKYTIIPRYKYTNIAIKLTDNVLNMLSNCNITIYYYVFNIAPTSFDILTNPYQNVFKLYVNPQDKEYVDSKLKEYNITNYYE